MPRVRPIQDNSGGRMALRADSVSLEEGLYLRNPYFPHVESFISGLLYRGNERFLLELGRYGTCDLVTIEYVRGEVEEFLRRPAVRLSDDERRRLMAIHDRSVFVSGDQPLEKIREVRGRIRD